MATSSVSVKDCEAEATREVRLDPQRVNKIFAELESAVRERAQNRPQYFDSFILEWRRSSGLIESAAEALRNGCALEKPSKEAEKSLWSPYEPLFPICYRYLIDDLTYEENRTFENVLAQTAEVWRLFFDAAKAHHPELEKVADEGVRASSVALAETRALYLGETERALTPSWARAVDALVKSVKEVFREIEK